MNILFILPRYQINKKSSTLEKELVQEFILNGHRCDVMTILEDGNKTKRITVDGVNISQVKVGDYYSKKTNKIKKGITMLKVPYLFTKELNYKKTEYDLVILSTPMMNNPYLMKQIKKRFGKKIMLIVWDIFPQNGKDIGIINNRILFNFFDKKYRKALDQADYISCMSKGNRKYLLKNYTGIEDKVFILKNWSKIIKIPNVSKTKIRKKYNLNSEDFVVIFGGNMGKPQKLENIIELAKVVKDKKDIKFIFIGNGTEKGKLIRIKEKKSLDNVSFMEYVPREDYEMLTASSDLGVVSLDERFTVPNFPSKTTDYFKLGLPILASLDTVAMRDYGYFIEKEVEAGLIACAGDTKNLKDNLLKLYNDNRLSKVLGGNGRRYYERELDVKKAYKTIMDKINGDEVNV